MRPPILLLVALAAVRGEPERDCPAECECLGEFVDCSGASRDALAELAVPAWAAVLDVGGAPPDRVATLAAPHLRELRLTRAELDRLPTLDAFPALHALSLAHNRIGALAADSFAAAPQLRELDLQHNSIARLDASIFRGLTELRALRLASNRIATLDADAFETLRSLRELNLNRNRVERLPRRLFRELGALETLELNRNRIREIDDLAFENLTGLATLELRRNEIETLRDGAFYGLKRVATLRLDRNSIASVSKRWTFGLDSLTTLSLANNRVESIEPDCWEWSGRLEELDLSGNRLRFVSAKAFDHLGALRRLRLDGNRISLVAERAFAPLRSLLRLDLSANEISWTVEDMSAPFAGLAKLEQFSLARNHVKSIGERAFAELSSLSTLDLSGNNITSVHERAFEPLERLEELLFDSTSLLCSCNLQWLPTWLARLSRRENATATCAYPPQLRGRRLLGLKRENFTCKDSPKPRIVDSPKSHVAIRGEAVRLTCSAFSSGASEMTFLWKRNNANLTDPQTRVSSTSDDDALYATSELVLADVSDSAAGKYQCVVSNGYGTTYSNKSRIQVVTFPKFLKKPSNVTVHAGDTAKLECSASGDPSPQIAWRKEGNDFPAARERRMHVMPSDDAYFILNSKLSDIGVYSCTAENAAGLIVSNATLNVLEAPSFVNKMENKEVVAGDSTVIECMIAGSPKPTVRWLKDNAPIVATERHFLTAEDQLLIIVNAVASDEGLYECEIANSLGTVRDSTELKVLPPVTSIFNAEDDMMGIIIITVVCCAVGTSIVWVVIIYQTRKRLKNSAVKFSPDSLQMAPLSVELDLDAPQIFSDDVSERSSCKDSGTGDSAKRSSSEIVPADELPTRLNESNVIVSVYVNPSHILHDENRSLLKKDRMYYDDECDHGMSIQMHRLDEIVHEANPNRTYPYS